MFRPLGNEKFFPPLPHPLGAEELDRNYQRTREELFEGPLEHAAYLLPYCILPAT
jgi:hypothetical protein